MATIITDKLGKYLIKNRSWQGIPSIDASADGALYASWYSGGAGEGPHNYVIMHESTDGGRTFSQPVAAVDPPGNVRAYDPAVFTGPDGRVRWYWAESHGMYDGRCGVWQSILTDGAFSEPMRICDGIMMNKPTVLSDGRWLVPAAIWNMEPYFKFTEGPVAAPDRIAPGCYAVESRDGGRSFRVIGSVENDAPSPDEHMVAERLDGTLWMLVRTKYGIGESFSDDGGITWTPLRPSSIKSPVSRFHIRRMPSGRLLLINHYGFTGRNNLYALLSDDDGSTWPHMLLLDERDKVSYPDAAVFPNGEIVIIYDRDRYGVSEILTARITENEIINRKLSRPGSFLKNVISSRS